MKKKIYLSAWKYNARQGVVREEDVLVSSYEPTSTEVYLGELEVDLDFAVPDPDVVLAAQIAAEEGELEEFRKKCLEEIAKREEKIQELKALTPPKEVEA